MKRLEIVLLSCIIFLPGIGITACDGGESTECSCVDGICSCPADHGLDKVEVFVTYVLNEGKEATKPGLEVKGSFQLQFEDVEPQLVSCQTKLKDTPSDLQCSLGMLPVTGELNFMVIIPEVEGDPTPACPTKLRQDCRGILQVEMFKNGQGTLLENMLVVHPDFPPGYVAYRVRIPE
jgi:hypothetical protein